MPHVSGLTVRQHERKAIALEGDFVVANEYREQVRFSPASAAQSSSIIKGKVTDISPGGMGLSFGLFVPRMCEGSVRVYSPTPASRASDGTPVYEVIFEHRVKVRRVYMSSHKPTYGVGVSFVDPDPDHEDRIREVLTVVERASAARDRADDEGADHA